MKTLALLCLVLSLPAHADTTCETALSLTAVVLPAPIEPETRAAEITARMLEILDRDAGPAGTRNAVAVLDETVRAAQDVVGTFLQTRENYPDVFDQNEPNVFAKGVLDELTKRLTGLAEINDEPPRFSFRTWRTERPVDLEKAVREVRYLHFAVKYAAGKLTESSDRVGRILRQTTDLREYFARATRVLELVRGELEARVAAELANRLYLMHADVAAQGQLLANVHLALEQRLQRDALTQDAIRTLLTLQLPLAAVMGSPKDLSPLDPGTFAAAPVAPAVAKPEVKKAEVASVDNLITMAKKSNANAQQQILCDFIDVNAKCLTVAQILKMALSTKTYEGQNAVVWRFVKARKSDLTQEDFVALANMAANDEYRTAIMQVMKTR